MGYGEGALWSRRSWSMRRQRLLQIVRFGMNRRSVLLTTTVCCLLLVVSLLVFVLYGQGTATIIERPYGPQSIDHLIVFVIVVLTLGMGSALIIRKERTKIRAEQEVLRYREKLEERNRAEEALQVERNKLKAILDSMTDGVYVVNENYEIVYCNPVIERKYGPIIHDRCYEHLGEGTTICEWCDGKEVFAGKTVLRETYSHRTGKTYEVLGIPFVWSDGIPCKLGIIRDITERKNAEEALRKSEGRLRDLSTQLLSAQEMERKRISTELHDELGQELSVMKLHVNFIEKQLSPDQDVLKLECRKALENVDQVIDSVRRLSRDLSPAILEDFGLSAAVRRVIASFAKRYGIKVAVDMIDVDSLIPRSSHTIIYRIVQEALTNIGKHSRAGNVRVTIGRNDSSVSFVIEDDGTGFDVEETLAQGPDDRGLGLVTMKGRARMLGGKVDIRSEKDSGTRISVSLPIKEQRRDHR